MAVAMRTMVAQKAAVRPARRAAALAVRCEARKVQTAAPVEFVERAVQAASVPATAFMANAMLVAPAAAKEAGKIFDFDLTLPLIAGQFLLLMIALDKLVYGPVGDVLDSRDSDLKEKLASVKDNSGELDAMMEEAGTVVSAARSEVADMVATAKKSATADAMAKYEDAKSKMDSELARAMDTLASTRAAAVADLEKEADALSDVIAKKALPV
mmetsp:Transcript_3214/g.11217  ORF Transcript_3214/g.11217 Transcript_3214/m.11217 type:complete len:213 (+) Transcript_3214:67-705(+)